MQQEFSTSRTCATCLRVGQPVVWDKNLQAYFCVSNIDCAERIFKAYPKGATMESNPTSDLDQTKENMIQLARIAATCVAEHYVTLLTHGVPINLACQLTMKYNEAYIVNIMTGRRVYNNE